MEIADFFLIYPSLKAGFEVIINEGVSNEQLIFIKNELGRAGESAGWCDVSKGSNWGIGQPQ